MQKTGKRLACVGFSCLSLIGASLFLTTGCKPSPEKIAVREALLNREIEKLFDRVQTLQAEDHGDEALQLVEQGLVNPKYKGFKARFFTQKTDLLLRQNKDKETCDLILQAWKNEPELARAVFGCVYNHYLQLNRHEDIRAWCTRLLAPGSGLPSDLRGPVLNWQLASALALSDEEGAKAVLDVMIGTLPPAEAVPLLQQALEGLIDSGRHVSAASLLKYLDGKNTDSPLYKRLFVTLSMRCVLANKEWQNMTSAFNACVSQLPDESLHKLLRTVFSALQKNGQPELLQSSCKQVIFNASEKTNSVHFAARVWVESGVAANKKVLPERLDALLNAKVSPVQVGNLFDRYFYEMTEELDIIRSLCALGERILAVCSDEATVNNIKVKILDGAFITDNFDLAVHMLEQGIPGKDKAWHDMSLPKVKAHRAMAQKKPREAVKYFRDFMNAWIASDQQEEFDPTSGIAYSREWILGRNANRIAGILDAIPDKAEADKARAEAKAYFKTALEKAANDAEALKLLKEETKNMGL